ncbi:MAG: phosphoribosylformylglycinamidine synthase subunit PurL [Actinobacteria bacterium]|nr:phosphoribosylformylglycinamidine synthase subunit PurL [Actinomycetota bacterium]
MTTAQAPHRALGLTDAEFDLICEKLGREPNATELAMFSLMWSEHCSYKHSKKLLGKLPVEGPHLLMGPGENAGAVRVGGGLAIAFKVESHNHPSAVEPFQGAATGVGGILRDIFAVGARPIAVLDSLRFGELDSARSRFLAARAVAGIGHYGNSIGVPTVGGEIYFEGPYEQNCLVNAMCLGLAREDRLIRSAAAGVGNHLVLFGASTGRDGIGGASVLASAELGEDDDSKRPTVQVGDPFEESKLVEASLELLEAELLASLQDLGAAGLTSASSEMASKGEVGLDIHVDRVPLREQDMEPFEIMVSESQERMLCVVEPERLEAVLAVCDKWDLHHAVIGEVTDTRHMRIYDGGELVGDIPVPALVDDCPMYDLAPAEPDGQIYPAPPRRLAEGLDAGETLLALLGSDNVASRRDYFEQYDCVVGSRTIKRPEQAEAAVLRLGANDGGTGRSPAGPPAGDAGPTIAVSIDGSGRRVAADPYRGTIGVVLECAANLACVGAEPLGLTNCLNFGNPEKPHIAWQLERSVSGMADALRALGVPVVGGNVSLYNQSGDGPIYPTPVVGMVGSLPDPTVVAGNTFNAEKMAVALMGPFEPSLAAGELAKLRGEELPTRLPDLDLSLHAEALRLLRDAVRDGTVRVARDVSEGGLATTLAECCLGGVGAKIDVAPLVERLARDTDPGANADAAAPAATLTEQALFGEGPGGFVIAGERDALLELSSRARRVGFLAIGVTGGDTLQINGFNDGDSSSEVATAAGAAGILKEISTAVSTIQRIHAGALAERASS